MENSQSLHYVRIDEDRCNGCVICMKACPTRAIRVRDRNLARIEGTCIDCGECIRVCPRGAIQAITTLSGKIDKGKAIIGVSPTLYSQFGDKVRPEDINLALKQLGFLDVIDQSDALEIFSLVVEEYLKKNRDKTEAPRPMISPICPVAVQLIYHRFPSLSKHVLPIIPPREYVARRLRKKAELKYGLKEKDVKFFHLTPCSAKMISIKNHYLMPRSYLNSAVGINNIYHELVAELKRSKRSNKSGPIRACISWGISGGEIGGMEGGNLLAVSGMAETIRYLQKIEMGLLDEIDYIEFRTCAEGCIGGPLTVTDKYQAKHTIHRLLQIHGAERGVKRSDVEKWMESPGFFTDIVVSGPPDGPIKRSVQEAIRRQEQVEEVYATLPLRECGICGSPDCRTFAEDVADNRVSRKKCAVQDLIKCKGEYDEGK